LTEVADYFSVPLPVVEALAAERDFPVLRIGTERRVRRGDLEAFFAEAFGTTFFTSE
jgi:excisionase family DNA binding protein